MKLVETASNIAVIIAAGAVAVTVIYDHVARPTFGGALAENAFSQQYKGKQAPVPGLGPSPGATTLVLFVSKTCHFCEESVPFYQRLAVVRSASSGHLKLVAAVPQAIETEAEANTYFADRGIALDAARPTSFRTIGMAATPTLALVDDRGIITDVWTGKLAPAEEAAVIGRIEAICHDCTKAGSAVKP